MKLPRLPFPPTDCEYIPIPKPKTHRAHMLSTFRKDCTKRQINTKQKHPDAGSTPPPNDEIRHRSKTNPEIKTWMDGEKPPMYTEIKTKYKQQWSSKNFKTNYYMLTGRSYTTCQPTSFSTYFFHTCNWQLKILQSLHTHSKQERKSSFQ